VALSGAAEEVALDDVHRHFRQREARVSRHDGAISPRLGAWFN
jgi:hypothetical protein